MVSEVHGIWRSAVGIPHLAALNQGGGAAVTSVSCASAGNCSAGGSYGPVVGTFWRIHAFVVSEVHGIWRKAIEVLDVAALNRGVDEAVSSVSCTAAGNCAASGYYTDRTGNLRGFLVGQVRGRWHSAIRVPGITGRQIGSAGVDSLSCASAGNCSSGANYANPSGDGQAYVVSEVRGSWHNALEVPGTAPPNKSGDAMVLSVSCVSAGNCGGGGFYGNTVGHTQPFVVSQAQAFAD